jgi:hypothetical protein
VWREIAPLGLAVALWPWLDVCVHNYSQGVAWRDTPMYVYPAWCILHGERLYQTIACPDGPLAIVVHVLMLALGGFHEAGWRRFDLGFHAAVGAVLGALLAPSGPRWLAVVRRMTWAGVGVAIWLTQVMAFEFIASLQREAYYVALGMVGLVLVYTSASRSRRVAAWMLCGGALLAGWTFWGKQTAGIYSALVLMTAWLLPATAGQPRRWRLKWIAAGTAASVVSILAFVAAVGSVRGMMLWFFRYNLEYYRFHDVVGMAEILGAPGLRDVFTAGGVVLAVGLAGLALGALPLRTAAFVIAPAIEVASAVGQMRGWRYHFVPAEFCAGVFALLALVHAWRFEEGDATRRALSTVGALGAFALVTWWCLGIAMSSPWMRGSESHRDDDGILDPIKASSVLAANTEPDDRVFHFGDDPSVLLFARRRPATPYEVAWMRDLMRHLPPQLPHELAETVRSLQTQLQTDDCARVLADPPPALVFRNGATGYDDHIIDTVYGYCPGLRPIVERQYHRVMSGPFQIFLRNDRPTVGSGP